MKTKTKIALALTIMLAAINLQSCKNSTMENSSERFKMNYVPAKTSNELVALRANKSANLIRTKSDFENVIKNQNTPLAKMSPEALERFKQDIVFREKVGIVGFNYQVLKSSLSEDDFNEVMALFGLDTKLGFWGFSVDKEVTKKMSIDRNLRANSSQSLLFEDYGGYQCISPHNCSKMSNYICLTGC